MNVWLFLFNLIPAFLLLDGGLLARARGLEAAPATATAPRGVSAMFGEFARGTRSSPSGRGARSTARGSAGCGGRSTRAGSSPRPRAAPWRARRSPSAWTGSTVADVMDRRARGDARRDVLGPGRGPSILAVPLGLVPGRRRGGHSPAPCARTPSPRRSPPATASGPSARSSTATRAVGRRRRGADRGAPGLRAARTPRRAHGRGPQRRARRRGVTLSGPARRRGCVPRGAEGHPGGERIRSSGSPDGASMPEHDVLIIGAGLAGQRAALAAARQARRWRSCPRCTRSSFALGRRCGRHQRGDQPMTTRGSRTRDTVKGADYLGDQDAIEIMCREAPDEVMHIEHLGVPFHRDEGGSMDPRRSAAVTSTDCFVAGHHRPGDPARPLRAV